MPDLGLPTITSGPLRIIRPGEEDGGFNRGTHRATNTRLGTGMMDQGPCYKGLGVTHSKYFNKCMLLLREQWSDQVTMLRMSRHATLSPVGFIRIKIRTKRIFTGTLCELDGRELRLRYLHLT